jgi:hypothetical protein
MRTRCGSRCPRFLPGRAFAAVGPGRAGIKRAITVQQRIDDAHWSLAMALAWITYRTEQAVIKITHGRWAPTETAISDLLSALRSGKLIAHGLFEGERTPHPIETALWSTFEIVVKQTMFAGHMVLPTSGRPVAMAKRVGSPQTRLLCCTVPAAKVRKLWLAAKLSAVAERRCQEYLLTEIRRSFDRAPKPKHELFADCQARFAGVSGRVSSGLGRMQSNRPALSAGPRLGDAGNHRIRAAGFDSR